MNIEKPIITTNKSEVDALEAELKRELEPAIDTGQPKIRILSLGAGVQSTTVLLMACVGEIQPIDHAIFADVGWDPKAVYEHLEWLLDYARRHGVNMHVLTGRNIRDDAMQAQVVGHKHNHRRWGSMPVYILNPDGSRGMVNRQCTSEYKVDPQRRKFRELLDLKPRQRWPKTAAMEHLFGISYDEVWRMRHPEGPWETTDHPLIDKRMTRLDCLVWLEAHGFPRPPRSSCIGCPFHSDMEWNEMKQNRPEEWADVVEFDRSIRNCGGMRGQVFLHRSCKPLAEVRFNLDPTPDMFGNECMGLCGT